MRKVSVIMPAYNCAGFIKESIESVLNQTYRDYELIIVDDGSSDATGSIAERYAASLPGIVRCLHLENKGPGAARNAGIQNAAGDYIAFLDSDDTWLPGKLEKQVAVLERDRHIGLVYCDNYFVDGERNVLWGHRRTVTLHRGMIADRLFQHCFIITSGTVARKACIDSIGYFREDIKTGEDYDYFLRLSYRFKIDWIEEKLFERRAVTDSLSNGDDCIIMTNDLEILTRFVQDQPEFYNEYRQIVRERLSSYYFTLGYTCIKLGRNLPGMRHLLQSLRYRINPKALKCLVMSPFPYTIFRSLKGRS